MKYSNNHNPASFLPRTGTGNQKNLLTSSQIMQILSRFPKHNRSDSKDIIQYHWRIMKRISESIQILNPDCVTMNINGKSYNVYYIEICGKIHSISAIKEKILTELTDEEINRLFMYNTQYNHAMIKPHSHCHNYNLAVLRYEGIVERQIYEKICKITHNNHIKTSKKNFIKNLLNNFFKEK